MAFIDNNYLDNTYKWINQTKLNEGQITYGLERASDYADQLTGFLITDKDIFGSNPDGYDDTAKAKIQKATAYVFDGMVEVGFDFEPGSTSASQGSTSGSKSKSVEEVGIPEFYLNKAKNLLESANVLIAQDVAVIPTFDEEDGNTTTPVYVSSYDTPLTRRTLTNSLADNLYFTPGVGIKITNKDNSNPNKGITIELDEDILIKGLTIDDAELVKTEAYYGIVNAPQGKIPVDEYNHRLSTINGKVESFTFEVVDADNATVKKSIKEYTEQFINNIAELNKGKFDTTGDGTKIVDLFNVDGKVISDGKVVAHFDLKNVSKDDFVAKLNEAGIVTSDNIKIYELDSNQWYKITTTGDGEWSANAYSGQTNLFMGVVNNQLVDYDSRWLVTNNGGQIRVYNEGGSIYIKTENGRGVLIVNNLEQTSTITVVTANDGDDAKEITTIQNIATTKYVDDKVAGIGAN